MQIQNSASFRFPALVKVALCILATASAVLAGYAQSSSKYANDTFTVISRTDHGPVHVHLKGEGDHCWASTSDDRNVAISMGDNLCTSSAEDVPDQALMYRPHHAGKDIIPHEWKGLFHQRSWHREGSAQSL